MLETAASWAGIVGTLLAASVSVAAVWLWLRGRNPVVAYALRTERRRTVGRALRANGLTRSQVRRACRRYAAGSLDGDPAISSESEFRWLDETTGSTLGVAMEGFGGALAQDLRALALAYQRFAVRLRSRGLLGGGTAPVLSDQATVAERVAARLDADAMFALGRAVPQDDGLELSLRGDATQLAFSFLKQGHGPGDGADLLRVSHIHRRLVVPGTLSETLATNDRVDTTPLRLSRDELTALDDKLRGKFFDGALPSLLAARLERDPASGWHRLHLSLAEASYSAVVATHNIGDRGVGRRKDQLDGEARLLTLTSLPVTSDGRILAVRRSGRVMTGQGMWQAGVNGNLEMRPRFGIHLDRDEWGAPDPLLAITREAKEELALEVEPRDLALLGMARFTNDQEVDMTVLLTTCRVRLTAADVVRGAADADPTEGLWESDGTFLSIPLPRSDVECDDLLAWTLRSGDHQPHLVASLVALCHPMLMERHHRDSQRVRAHLRQLADGAATPEPDGVCQLSRDLLAG